MVTTELSQQIETQLEKATLDVFETMVFMSADVLSKEPPGPIDFGHELVASLGFTGTHTGLIVVLASMSLAKTITANMLGMEEEELEGTGDISDAMGEIANMIAGNVKNRYVEDGSVMDLAVPMVAIGSDPNASYSVKTKADEGSRIHFTMEDDDEMIVEMRLRSSE